MNAGSHRTPHPARGRALFLLSAALFLGLGEVQADDPLELAAVAPQVFANDLETKLTITGSGFSSETQITLVGGGIYEIGSTERNDLIIGSGLAIADDLVYASGIGLSVLDILDPASPELVARNDTRCTGRLALARGHIYFTMTEWNTPGLCVLDVTDPARPVEVLKKELPCAARSVAATPDALYLACYSGELLVMDLADPARPVISARIPVGQSDASVAVHENLLLFVDAETGLFTFSLDEPLSPALLGHESRAVGRRVAAAQAHAYVLGFEEKDGVQVVDIGDPRHPRLLGASPT